jgi:hypothetical protein
MKTIPMLLALGTVAALLGMTGKIEVSESAQSDVYRSQQDVPPAQ